MIIVEIRILKKLICEEFVNFQKILTLSSFYGILSFISSKET